MNETYNGILITAEDIQDLKKHIDEQNSTNNRKGSYFEFLKPIKNGVQVTNYVGILQTKSGLIIEILPKIYGKSNEDKRRTRELFLRMLKMVENIDGKKFNLSQLSHHKNNIFEVFIAMFLEQNNHVIKRGIKSDYISIQRNERFLKGKLLLTQHIKKNTLNKAKFYSEFDEYFIDTPENQLIKTTLLFLLKHSKDIKNLRIIREQLSYFENVTITYTPNKSYKKIQLGRNYSYYQQALEWCKIFLNRNSFTSFGGASLAFALLFPMETIFEAYIAKIVKRSLPEHEISEQDKSYWLFDETDESKKEYQLRPDLVIRDKNERTLIADTKWKILNSSGPAQSDLYQMYAYFARYHQKEKNVEAVMLIYPYSAEYPEKKFISIKNKEGKIGAKIQLKYVDLFSENIESDIRKMFIEYNRDEEAEKA